MAIPSTDADTARVGSLHVQDLSVARGGLTLLAGLSFRVYAGSACVVRGPNGAGKTTLLRTIAGLQPSVRGAAFPGQDAIAYSSHADGLKATLTVRENLMFWARIYGHRDIASALSAFDLWPLADRPAGQLSAGQKRRLGLARLCVTHRPIWLLDEPTVSLDTPSVTLFTATVSAHLQRGGIALLATHIDLGLGETQVLDISPYRTRGTPASAPGTADDFSREDGEAFL